MGVLDLEISDDWGGLGEHVRDVARRRRLVTTNGCFDLLHLGHLRFLEQARALGEALVVGVNSDHSVRRLKGAGRPILDVATRTAMLLALPPVDGVVIFNDATPQRMIERLRPAIHCKGGDYAGSDLPEAAAVASVGGEVRILPMLDGHSTSAILRRAAGAERGENKGDQRGGPPSTSDEQEALHLMLAAADVLRRSAYRLAPGVAAEAARITDVLASGGTVFSCGNGGSAADAQHLAGELIGRFGRQRRALRAVALCADITVLTAVSNDYGYDHVYARQLEALGRPGDLLVAISTSGRSPNVLNAAATATRLGLRTTALTGDSDGPLAGLVEHTLIVPTDNTALVQQGHRALLHAICELVEQHLTQR